MIYKIIVWYRYVINSEQEKESEIYEVKADNIHDAFRRIRIKYFEGNSRIPFSYSLAIEPYIWYKPIQTCVKDKAFNEPILDKEY